eukprot:CAMPEP_0178570026 /NCGR_PEP_ID=MMETSP0697-20121206/16826_1 /TAXON_ID=265572 /ORGANISM="Extubocellulus spinifer, Strain CCMP396" /LENGTH=435 /DNA_ID=CAMNT_0020204373 /DNA_START=45 /DNA_END=1352 /DNA_ORIENTATION=+
MSGPQHQRDTDTVSSSNTRSNGKVNADLVLTKMLAEEDRVRSSVVRTRQVQVQEVPSSATATANDAAAKNSDTADTSDTANNTTNTAAMTIWRERVSQWCYRVIDHIGSDRGIVFNVMSLLDTYIDIRPPQNYDAATYQLLAMSSLYLVLRLRERSTRLTVAQMMSMSRDDGDGVVTPDRIAHTMKSIVHALPSSWKDICHAPSPGEFVFVYVEQLRVASSSSSSRLQDLLQASKWSSILDDAAYLAELSVCDSYLRDERPSVIAYAALLNALSDNPDLGRDLQILQTVTGYDVSNNATTTVRSIYDRIAYVHSQSSDYDQQTPSNRVASTTAAAAPTVIPPEEDSVHKDEVEVNTGTPCRQSQLSAVVSYDDVSTVVGAALTVGETPPLSEDSGEDGDDDDVDIISSTPASGIKRVRNYSSSLSEQKAAKRVRV